MRLVILDRDGVINADSDDHVRSLAEWKPLPGAIAAIADLSRAGFTVVVATNQSGIARGYFAVEAMRDIHDALIRAVVEAGGEIAHIAFCPHGPGDGCACRKPLPGMIDEILAALDVPTDAERWMVGDSLRDLQAGAARGCRLVLVRTGKGERTLREHHAEVPSGTMVVDDLRQFADIALAGVEATP